MNIGVHWVCYFHVSRHYESKINHPVTQTGFLFIPYSALRDGSSCYRRTNETTVQQESSLVSMAVVNLAQICSFVVFLKLNMCASHRIVNTFDNSTLDPLVNMWVSTHFPTAVSLNVSEECKSHTQMYLTAYRKKHPSALKSRYNQEFILLSSVILQKVSNCD